MIVTEEIVDIVDEGMNDVIFNNIIVDERETGTGSNENESQIIAESPLDWSKYRPTMLRSKKNELLKTPKASKHGLETSWCFEKANF